MAPRHGLELRVRARADRRREAHRRSRRSGCSCRPARRATRASRTSWPRRRSSPACRSIALVVPPVPGGDGEVDPAVLVVCRKLGITDVFRVNGPAGVAALGFGTESIPQGAQGRRTRLAGRHDRPGRDAAPRRRDDDAARSDREPRDRRRHGRPVPPRRRPADRGRARHRLVGRAGDDVDERRRRRRRRARRARSPSCPRYGPTAARASLGANGGCVLVADLDEAVDVANRYAPEHLQVAVADDAEDARGRRARSTPARSSSASTRRSAPPTS